MSRIPVVSAYVLVGAALAFLAAPSAVQAQEPGSLFGTVFDQQTLQPLPGATISIEDGEVTSQSAQDGSFTLHDLPAGPLTLRLSAPGYASAVEQVELTSGEVLFQQFAILPLSATLGEVLVLTGRSRGDFGSSAEVTGDRGGIAATAVDLLAQRVPGLTVGRRTGNIGSSSDIVIRGISSMTQSSAPIIFLDGIRLSQSSSGPRTGTSDNGFDILDAIPASDIKRIRVLRGSSASASYGDSANGVIVIETHDRRE